MALELGFRLQRLLASGRWGFKPLLVARSLLATVAFVLAAWRPIGCWPGRGLTGVLVLSRKPDTDGQNVIAATPPNALAASFGAQPAGAFGPCWSTYPRHLAGLHAGAGTRNPPPARPRASIPAGPAPPARPLPAAAAGLTVRYRWWCRPRCLAFNSPLLGGRAYASKNVEQGRWVWLHNCLVPASHRLLSWAGGLRGAIGTLLQFRLGPTRPAWRKGWRCRWRLLACSHALPCSMLAAQCGGPP